jgi:acetyltransferase-like isoleucine patch superfamily enzyme
MAKDIIMKLFYKENLSNGRQHIYFCGIKIASYKERSTKHNVKIFGKNNEIINQQQSCNCSIYGNNNKIIFGKNVHWIGSIFIGLPDVPTDNCVVLIGDESSSNGTAIRICEDNTNIEIGSGCMFSAGISMWASDTHTITDMTGNITNIGKYIKIGKHVWVGMNATILKNTTISDNCIIGTQSVVSGKFNKSNCVIAGNPCKVVKENVNWDNRRPKQYMVSMKK